MRICVQSEPFNIAKELQGFGAGRGDIGAVVSFSGLVRDDSGHLQMLEVEHYPGMTEKSLSSCAQEAVTRWELADVLVIHRFGRLQVGAPIMMVATAARHRNAAFEAAEFLMDYLKSRAPFWKREITAQGTQWVAAKDSDEAALARW
ncbi:molybdenum cofactor biosynthesis protein MoaE [Thioclava sp. SK-1]|uniref:molybdenum cofactor biosynthesis protein MoaE n=1 Tax=Thioclava sp. SK-1 TaxID=1889770 RepID=UPI000825C8D2|nr:molybdenum cofactor biosynthesis protein MoaE [Thioclava sp. SK-1]OCX66514.1 molybdenum cofactor biosynthesis protein MoaE [Thioclava sp. SK-1]